MPAVRDLVLNLQERRQGNALLAAANDLDKLAHGADASGDAFARMKTDAQRLDAQIAMTKDRIKDLNVQFARTGDTSLFGDISAAERDLRRLQKAMRAINPAEVTNDFGMQIGAAFGGLRGAAMPAVVAALVGAAVAAAPTIGAILGGSIAGLAGTGALAAGVLSTVKDERVQAAAKAAGQDIAGQFFAGGEALVDPVLKAIGTIEHAFTEMHVSDALAKLGPTIEMIAEGFGGAATEFMPGFNEFLDRIGPLADAGAKGITDIGQALGEALENIANSPGTVEGLETALSLLSGTVRGLGKSLEFLGDRYHEWGILQAKVFGGLEDVLGIFGDNQFARGAARLNDIFERMTGTGENLHGTFSKLGHEAVDPFAGYLRRAQEQMKRLHEETLASAAALEEFWHQVRKADDANVSWERALDDLTDSVQENGRTLDIHTEKGRRNHEAVVAAIEAAQAQYRANIDAGMSAEQAGKQFRDQVAALEAVAVKAGLAKSELDKLAQKYVISVAVVGLNSFAQAALAAFYHQGSGPAGQVNTGRPMKEFAAGGTTPVGEIFKVHQDELLFSDRSHYVATKTQAAALGSGGQVVISFAATGDALLDAVLRELKKYIRINGGTASDSVQTALGY